jgi:predicted nuclease with TOPRIM domain
MPGQKKKYLEEIYMPEQSKEELQKKLREVEEEIAQLNERIPPHSVKPVFIQQLDELEERREAIKAKLLEP